MSFKEFISQPSILVIFILGVLFSIGTTILRQCKRQTEELEQMNNDDNDNSPMANRKDIQNGKTN